MEQQFGYFEEMDSYFDREELNAYHDMIDNIPLPTYEEVNEILARFADENILQQVDSKTFGI